MWGGSRRVIEENLLGEEFFLGDRVQVAEGGFRVACIIVEYMRLVFGLGLYHLVFEILFSFMQFCYVLGGWVTLACLLTE